MTSKTKNRPLASKPQRILPKETETDNTNVIYILSDQSTSAVKAESDNIIDNSDDPIIEIFDGGQETVLGSNEEDPQQIYQIIEQTSEDFTDTEGEENGYTKTITIVSEDQGEVGEDIVYVTSEDNVVRDAQGQVAFVQVRL